MQYFFHSIAALAMLLATSGAWAMQGLKLTKVVPRSTYDGTPGAEIVSLGFSDGMDIKVAVYLPSHGSFDLPPIGLMAGYTMDFSYLHAAAKALTSRGFPVYLVQPPGNGDGPIRSQLPSNQDGYHNTIEGTAAMYLDGVGEAMFSRFGHKSIFLGHSRAGYQVRFFMTGLRYNGRNSSGRPILEYSKAALENVAKNFLAIGSLYSPISPQPGMIDIVTNSRKTFEILNHLERLMRRDQENLRFVLNPFRIKFLDRIGEALTKTGEHIVQHDLAKLLSGNRPLNVSDRRAYEYLQKTYGNEINLPSWEEHARNIERAQWISHGADPEALMHALKFGSRAGPTPEAERELHEITARRHGISGWQTSGVGPDGKPYSILRAMRRAQSDVHLPYLLFDATGDATPEASIREAKFLCGTRCVVEGSHGGAIMSVSATRQLVGYLQDYCEALLREK